MSYQPRQQIRFAEFELDAAHRLLRREGKPLALNPKAFDLLVYLTENAGKIVTKDEILDAVWAGQFVEEANLKVQISTLRKALGEQKDEHRFLVTIPGKGYKFVADVQSCETETELVVEHHTTTHVVLAQETDKNGFSDLETAVSSSKFQVPDLASSDPLSLATIRFQSDSVQSSGKHAKRSHIILAAGGLLFLLLAVGIGFWRYKEREAIKPPIPFQQITIEQLTSNSKANLAALSPDGKLFVYVSKNRGLETLLLGHVEGGEPKELRPLADVTYLSVKFSPDGSSIYYVVSGAEYPTGVLLKIPTFGGVPEKLLENINTRVAFSPDMKQIAYARHNVEKKTSALVIANIDGMNERELVSRPETLSFRSFSPSWSPDGKTIAAGAVADENTESYEVFLVSVSDGQIRPLTGSAWNEVLATVWLVDGSGLIVVAKEKDYWGNTQLWRVSYPEGTASKIFSDLDSYNAATISLSSDGKLLLAIQIQMMSSIWITPADSLNQAKQITFGSVGRLDGGSSLDWMPDGRMLYGTRVKDSMTIWTMNADGSKQKQLTSVGYIDTHLSVTTDGRYMVFQSNRSGDWEIWRANTDGSNMKQLTAGGKNEEPHVSPDGKWVVYTSLRDGLRTVWRVSIEGSETIRLSDKPVSWPRISPDGKLIACGYNADGKPKLAILQIEGGQPVKLFDVPRRANFFYGIRWMPDGKAVTYRDWANGIWRQPIEGSEPKRLEGLPEEKLGSYGWSKDGKKLAFVRGAELRDVVLIRNNQNISQNVRRTLSF